MTKENLSPIKSRLREFLSLRNVTYNEHTKTYRCPNPSHNDENPSAVVYDNTHLLYCPVCEDKYDVFKIEEFITGEHDFVKLKKSVKELLHITDMNNDAPAKPEKHVTDKPVPVAIPRDQIAEIYGKQKAFFERVGKSSKWGDLKTAWQYSDENNDVIAIDIRYEITDADGTVIDKTVMTWWYNGKTWQTKNYPVIIYNLYEAIHSEKPILIVEGAKCAYEGKKNLSEWFTVVSWNGGSGKAHLVDWSPLANKEIFILPDDDAPGIKAAMTIKEKLPQSKVVHSVKAARAIKEKGADIIEILQIMSPQELTGFILDKNNHHGHDDIVSSPLTSKPSGDLQDTESGVTVLSQQPGTSSPDGVLTNNTDNDGLPFKILGLGDDGQAYFIGHDDRLYVKKLEGINRQFLRMLAPPNPFWVSEYPSKQGVRWEDAESDIVLMSQRKDFDKDIIRGRGAWRDNGKIIYHDGTSPKGEISGKFMYLKLRKNDIGINDEPIDAETSREIARNIMNVSFETKTDAARCMAWAALAPFAGALRYRPTLLITGSSGSGKSTVLKDIICRIAHNAIKGDARETTPAGIRQKTGKDAAVWILDEAEKKTEKQKFNMDEIFSFMRSNFSDDSFDSYKGTKDGTYLTYKMNSMFCLAAIDPTIQEAADSNRIFKINIAKPTREQQQEWQRSTSKNIDRLLTHENCRRILARTWQNLEKIESLIDPVAHAIGNKTGKDLRSCKSDAYLLSTFIVVYEHNDDPTEEQIANSIDKYYQYQEPEESRNESEEWVDTYLDTIVEVLHENGREKLTLRECLTREYRDEKYDENGHPVALPPSMKKSYRETTGRYGVRIADNGNIAIASNHTAIKNIMKCVDGYYAILQRHPGFVKQPKGNFKNVTFPDKQRQCTIIRGVLLLKSTDKTDDEKLADVIMG